MRIHPSLCVLGLAGALAFSGCESQSTSSRATAAPGKAPASRPLLQLRDGDRAVFIGDTFIEREQTYGWIELMLTTAFRDQKVTFRNLGWSADLPDGESRLGLSLGQAGTEPPGEAWMLLQKQIQETKPTVAFLGYGMAASFAGEAGLPKFRQDYLRLLDTLEKLSPGCRAVVLSPVRHLRLPAPLPNPDRHNQQLQNITQALREIAGSRNLPFVSLLEAFPVQTNPTTATRWSDNGIHLTSDGYRQLASFLEKALGLSAAAPSSAHAETVRRIILRKNEFYFHRSRPANMAYIFGFRRAEQGRNAVEMPKFDPLIEAEEKKIWQLVRSVGDARFQPGAHLQPAELRDKPAAARFTPQPKPQFTVAEGFEVTLWAENPLLAKPIQMNFDPAGRLWIASSEVYPQVEPGQAAHDKIIVLEDTTGGGKADKATVFADGLLIPTGVIPGDGGVYVAQSTELLFLKDTDGDGKADQRRVVLSGFGTEDTHHNLHTLRWGHDGRLWMNQSIYTRTETETPHGVFRLRSGGVMALRTGTLEIDTLYRGWVNSWGHQFDAFGQSFATDGAGGAGINWAMPGGMYFTYARARRILPSVSPGSYPKFASLDIVHSPHFPDDWQGDAITCDFRAHRVARFKLSEQGAAYTAKEMPELLRTSDVTFRPIDARFGPDGALYIADWSNPIIQHGEVDFRDPRRDHEHGRVWRVRWKGKPLQTQRDWTRAESPVLLGELLSPNGFNRAQANRVLTERGSRILPDLDRWSRGQTSEPALLQALWMYQAIDRPNPPLLRRLLSAQDARVRAAAVRVLGEWAPQPALTDPFRLTDGSGSTLLPVTVRPPSIDKNEAIQLLGQAAADSHLRVKVEAVRALARIPDLRSVEIVLGLIDSMASDSFLEYALWLSINDLSRVWLASLESGAWKMDGRQKQLEFALKSIEPAQASLVLNRLTTSNPLPADGSGPWIELIGQAGDARQLARLFQQVLSKGFHDNAAPRALGALAEAARLRNSKPEGSLDGLSTLLQSSPEPIRIAAIRLAGRWKQMSAGGVLAALAGGESTPLETRQVAVDALREMGGSEGIGLLRQVFSQSSSAPVRRSSAIALASLGLQNALPQVIEMLGATTQEQDAIQLWRQLLTIRGAGPVLAKGLPPSGLPEAVAKAGLRVAREGGRKEPELILALAQTAGSTPEEKVLSARELQEWAATAMSKGDAHRGEFIYRRPELGCITCHSIGGAGGKVGPDMTSIGASAPPDYLIESLLYPNAKIKEGYHSVRVDTIDDQELSGILVRDTANELILRNAQNTEVSVAKNKIKARANGLSLMPSGLADPLSAEEKLDLFRFMAELGKAGAFDASKGGVARLWRLRGRVHTEDQAGADAPPARPVDDRFWMPVFSLVDGRLPKSEMAPIVENANRGTSAVGLHAATQFQTSKSGPVLLKISGVSKVQSWINDKSMGTNPEIKVELPAGRHTLILRLDPRQLPDDLAVRSTDVTFETQ